MSGTPTDLYDFCTDLLNVGAAALGGLAPERRYVSVNPPSLDCCDQLTVHPGLVSEAPLNNPNGPDTRGPLHSIAGPTIITCETILTVAWFVSVPETPDTVIPAAQLDAEGARVASGGWALWNGVRSAIRAGVLANVCRGVRVDALQPLPAQGAMAGWTLPLEVVLDGYDLTWQVA